MRISYIIPLYNGKKYIKDAIESIRKQNYCNELNAEIEIIVVEDGSTEPVEIMLDPDIMYFFKGHEGAASARNLGLSKASGDYIMFLDADDYLEPNAFCELMEALRKDNADISFGKAVEFVSDEISCEDRKSLSYRSVPFGGVLPGCSLIKKSVFDEVGLFDASLTSGETVDWMIRLKKAGVKTANTEAVTLKRRIHLNNTGRIDRLNEMKNYAAILRKRMAEQGKRQ